MGIADKVKKSENSDIYAINCSEEGMPWDFFVAFDDSQYTPDISISSGPDAITVYEFETARNIALAMQYFIRKWEEREKANGHDV